MPTQFTVTRAEGERLPHAENHSPFEVLVYTVPSGSRPLNLVTVDGVKYPVLIYQTEIGVSLHTRLQIYCIPENAQISDEWLEDHFYWRSQISKSNAMHFFVHNIWKSVFRYGKK
jgi:hypothetical protein